MHQLAYLLLWVGGLNWGLVGLFEFNLIAAMGLPSGVEKLIYTLVGVSAAYLLMSHRGYCKHCMEAGKK